MLTQSNSDEILKTKRLLLSNNNKSDIIVSTNHQQQQQQQQQQTTTILYYSSIVIKKVVLPIFFTSYSCCEFRVSLCYVTGMYIPSKLDKFGIKFWLASDSNNKYIINGFPYLEKEETRSSSIPLGEFVVFKLVEPFTRCWRHVTMDNCFTSASLTTKLLAKRTALFGTIRNNRRELPKLAKSAKDELERLSTILYKSSNLTIYKSKPTKKVTILNKTLQRKQNN
ncbi:piggyBac transposable element-derived protein 4-like [Vespula squamosa]|uniref:PiggyBac transposable element-derived protein 4-like n=1 Tax=Vespula squamosa TaxID=30214 RepID=A0ABD2ATU7_VESSQ